MEKGHLTLRSEPPDLWDPSDPSNMHAIPPNSIPEKWLPKMLDADMSSRYREVILIIGVIFLAGIVAVWGLAMLK